MDVAVKLTVAPWLVMVKPALIGLKPHQMPVWGNIHQPSTVVSDGGKNALCMLQVQRALHAHVSR